MKFTLVIHAAPLSAQAGETALRFARAALAAGHQIHRIFLYRDGVQNANALSVAPQDELNLPNLWQAFISEHQIDTVVCIAAAIRRGVIDQSEARRYNKTQHSLIDQAELSGLGQLISAALESDRVVTFGGQG